MDGRYESDLTAVDPVTLEIKKSLHLAYPNYSGIWQLPAGSCFSHCWTALSRPFDDTTLEHLWKTNMGPGFAAPPMTFEVGGRHYFAIAPGRAQRPRANLSSHRNSRSSATRLCWYVLTNESTDLCTLFPLDSAWFTRNRESSCSPHTTISSQGHL